MNDPNADENRIVRLMKRFAVVPLRHAADLAIYGVDAATMALLEPLLEAHLGSLSYLSLSGVKDLILESTGRAIPLLHVQHGPCAAPGEAQPREGHTHMFCCVAGTPLDRALRARGCSPMATAAIVAHRMAHSDWHFVLTSDI